MATTDIKKESTHLKSEYTMTNSEWIDFILPLVALAVDLLTPFLIWKGILPSQVRWISDLAIVTMIGLSVARMLVLDRIPKVIPIILGTTIIWVTVALFEGQGGLPTIWGWWVLFKYPLVGLYVYLIPKPASNFVGILHRVCMAILWLQVIVQIGQYLTGETPGDDLAGTFGSYGTGSLILFIAFMLAWAFGNWLATGQWKMLLWVLLLGGTSSTLGEMKLFPIMVIIMGFLTISIHLIRGGQLRKMLNYLILLGGTVILFGVFYNTFVSEALGVTKIEDYLIDAETLNSYLSIEARTASGSYDIGRMTALRYGWQVIQRDYTTLLFGMGLGSRGESTALGAVGSGLASGYYGLARGSSLLVFLQELGIVGLTFLLFFFVSVIQKLNQQISRTKDQKLISLLNGLVIFTLLWPLWLWYLTTWGLRFPMLLYWISIGYVSNPASIISKSLCQSSDKR